MSGEPGDQPSSGLTCARPPTPSSDSLPPAGRRQHQRKPAFAPICRPEHLVSSLCRIAPRRIRLSSRPSNVSRFAAVPAWMA